MTSIIWLRFCNCTRFYENIENIVKNILTRAMDAYLKVERTLKNGMQTRIGEHSRKKNTT